MSTAAGIKATAAILHALGLPGAAVIGHGEASDQRDWSDPGLDMGAVRRDVTRLLADPTLPIGDDMPLTDAEIKRISDAVWYRKPTPKAADPDLSATMQQWLYATTAHTKQLTTQVAKLAAQVAEIQARLDK